MNPTTETSPSPWLPPIALPAESAAAFRAGQIDRCEASVRLSLAEFPYLRDHGFHDMVVLPGSFYLALARQLHREILDQDATHLEQMLFERPVILSEEVELTVALERAGDDRVRYIFLESGQTCAQVIVAPPIVLSETEFPPIPASISGSDFYADSLRNGNQYGPSFQLLQGISGLGDQRSAEFAEIEDALSPAALDAAPQLLSAFTLGNGKTFILQAISELMIGSEIGAPHSAVAFADGRVHVLDAAGLVLWEMTGVQLAFVDAPASKKADLPVCVASTFTIEPIEDSLRFWAAKFGREVKIDFAPYNQVFQQLLDSSSGFRRNVDGINLLAIALEDWQREKSTTLKSAPPELFGDRERITLPNGLEIAHLNAYETNYVYQEIFEDESYLRHGIQLKDDAVVIDIGANIGLFSLFVLSRCANPKVYSFEPSPRVFDLLQTNCAAYGGSDKVRAFNRGVAEETGTAEFTFYESSSVFSSFHPDEGEDRAAVEAVVRNVLEHELAGSTARDEDVEELMADRLQAETIQCPLTSVSDLIREHQITRIDLLKIDAEKSELGILRGIEEAQWPLIDQIVIEIHDRTGAAVKSVETMLTGRGFHCDVVEEKLLTTSGLYNLYARRHPAQTAAAETGLSQKLDEFCAALDTFAFASTAPLVLAITPRANSGPLDAAEDRLIAHAARHSSICPLSSSQIRAQFPVRQWHDPHSHQLGHMPFTREGYTALGSGLFRALFQIAATPVKVIALDCDNTLWQGQVGEDGPTGVLISEPFRRLQETIVKQAEAGVLIALCSKNNEADALAVFEAHPEMPLRREHLAAWQIDWNSKAENLRALAAQLNLGLESFVFIDDNPVECATVRAGCPEALVLQLPAESERIPAFLKSQWIFDRATATREDRERGQWYRANADREEERAAAPTLRDFLAGLQLRIETREPTDEELARVAQLTVRTNQFNLTTIRRSESEIRAQLRAGATCLVTTVSDRFGNYGLVGLTLTTSTTDCCVLDTMLLSCRALGKGVEHQMLAAVAKRAIAEGQLIVEISCQATERNEPARQFFQSLTPTAEIGTPLKLAAADLAELRYEPAEQPAIKPAIVSTASRAGQFANLSATMQELGDELHTVDAIIAAIDRERRNSQPEESISIAGGSGLEQSLANIWRKALGKNSINLNDNFFDVGGTSLKAVVVLAMIRKELQKDISIVALFEAPTIALLAARLDGSSDSIAAETAETAESRGRQRRQKLLKRRVA